MDYILKNKDIKYIINTRLREELTKENSNGYNCYIATKIRLILNLLKKEDMEMDERRMGYARIDSSWTLF